MDAVLPFVLILAGFYEQLIKQIGNIADLAEDASDELEFAAMKSVG